MLATLVLNCQAPGVPPPRAPPQDGCVTGGTPPAPPAGGVADLTPPGGPPGGAPRPVCGRGMCRGAHAWLLLPLRAARRASISICEESVSSSANWASREEAASSILP